MLENLKTKSAAQARFLRGLPGQRREVLDGFLGASAAPIFFSFSKGVVDCLATIRTFSQAIPMTDIVPSSSDTSKLVIS